MTMCNLPPDVPEQLGSMVFALASCLMLSPAVYVGWGPIWRFCVSLALKLPSKQHLLKEKCKQAPLCEGKLSCWLKSPPPFFPLQPVVCLAASACSNLMGIARMQAGAAWGMSSKRPFQRKATTLMPNTPTTARRLPSLQPLLLLLACPTRSACLLSLCSGHHILSVIEDRKIGSAGMRSLTEHTKRHSYGCRGSCHKTTGHR